MLSLLCGVLLVCLHSCQNNNLPKSADSKGFYASNELSAQPISQDVGTNISQGTVYVCKSAGAKKYHFDESCRGLSNCKHTIVKMSEKDAQEIGLGLCGWED